MWGFKKKESLDMRKLLPLVMKLGNFLKEGYDHYIDHRQLDDSLSKQDVADFIYVKMESWNPLIKGKEILDEDIKKAAAQFVAGLAINLAKE